MRSIGHERAGLPPDTAQIEGPLVQRQVSVGLPVEAAVWFSSCGMASACLARRAAVPAPFPSHCPARSLHAPDLPDFLHPKLLSLHILDPHSKAFKPSSSHLLPHTHPVLLAR